MRINLNYDNYRTVHMYGIEIGEFKFRDEFDEVDTSYGIGNRFGVLIKILYENKVGLPQNIPNTKGMNLVAVPGFLDYVGYEALLPYEQCVMTKVQMDKNLHDLAVYLYGEEIAKKIQPKEIFKSWSE